jgi:F-type H+-transporting ATPase subunit delta
VTRRAAAKRYAKALFDVALQEADVQKVDDELQRFASLIRGHHELEQALANPAIPAARKEAVAKALLDRAGSMSAPLAKLILLLAAKDRLVLLSEVASSYRERLLDHQKIVSGTVTTAVSIGEGKLRALESSLGRATGRRVMLDSRVDAAIIGGVITRLGSTVYDGSVTTQLQKMKQALVEAGQ